MHAISDHHCGNPFNQRRMVVPMQCGVLLERPSQSYAMHSSMHLLIVWVPPSGRVSVGRADVYRSGQLGEYAWAMIR